MYNLFSLNYRSPNYNTTKCKNQKGVQFVRGEHVDIFKIMVQNYKNAKVVHGILGSILVILAKDETKEKGHIAWDHCSKTLVEFYGPKNEHFCLSNYEEVVGTSDKRYNKIVDGFCNNHIGAFVRIVMVKPLHESLSRLMLVISCTCNYFDAS